MDLKNAPRWLLLAALVYAPWAFGSTRPWTIDILNILLGVILVLWLASATITRSWRSIPIPLLLGVAYLALHGWAMALNARFTYDEPSRTFVEQTPLLAMLPGSIDGTRSLQLALRTSLLLGITCFVCQFAPNPVWRKRLIYTMALTGASLVIFGLIQRLLNAPAIFWLTRNTGETFFATFRYHNNAGSFMNLVWPLVAAIVVTTLRLPLRDRLNSSNPDSSHPSVQLWVRLAWVGILLACFTGLLVSGARAASVIALLFIGLWVAWWIRQTRQEKLPQINMATTAIAGVLGLMLLASVAATAGLDVSLHRWNKTEEIFSLQNPRLIVDEVCITKMIPESGWFGFGPGTFRRAFPYFTNDLGDKISGVWLDAHQDSLQTLIEWGYIGALAWGVCIFGGLLNSFRKPNHTSFTDQTAHFALLTAAGTILLHSQVDFPLQIASLQLYFATILALLWTRPYWSTARG